MLYALYYYVGSNFSSACANTVFDAPFKIIVKIPSIKNFSSKISEVLIWENNLLVTEMFALHAARWGI